MSSLNAQLKQSLLQIPVLGHAKRGVAAEILSVTVAIH